MWGVSTDCLALAGAGVTQCFACQNRVVLAASWRHQLKLYSTARRTRDAITPVLVQMAIWAMLESAGPYLYGLSPHALLSCLVLGSPCGLCSLGFAPLLYVPQLIYKLPVLGAAAILVAAGQLACFVKAVWQCCVGVGRAMSQARGPTSTWVVNVVSALTLAAFWMLCALALENLLLVTVCA